MSAKEPESGDQIDQGKTYQVVFILKENEDCIGAGVSSQVYDESINDNTNVKTYFIIEKLLDLSRFSGSEAGYQYSEIGKNFDNNWNTKPEIQICSGDDPVSRLEKENKFRLRFTTFKNTEFKYNLIIRSRYGVIFQDFKNNN